MTVTSFPTTSSNCLFCPVIHFKIIWNGDKHQILTFQKLRLKNPWHSVAVPQLSVLSHDLPQQTDLRSCHGIVIFYGSTYHFLILSLVLINYPVNYWSDGINHFKYLSPAVLVVSPLLYYHFRSGKVNCHFLSQFFRWIAVTLYKHV